MTVVVVENWRRRQRLDRRLKTEIFVRQHLQQYQTLPRVSLLVLDEEQRIVGGSVTKANLRDQEERERSCESCD